MGQVERTTKTSIARILGRSLILVTLIPFVPLAALTFLGYRGEATRLEHDIQATNGQIAVLAANYLDGLLRHVGQQLRSAPPGGGLPPRIPGVRWESIAADETVQASQLDVPRTRVSAAYAKALAPPGEAHWTSGVGPYLAGAPPTVLVSRATGAGWLVGILIPEELHAAVVALSSAGLDRHIYAVDGSGFLVFYSDLALSRRGVDLRDNPPIRLFLQGRTGELHYRSVVSGKDRLGVVQSLVEGPWAIVVSADVASRLVGLRGRYLAMAWSIAFALVAAVVLLTWTSRQMVQPILEIRDALHRETGSPPGPLAVSPATRRITELAEVVEAFDDLQARYSTTEAELLQAEKNALLGQLASGVAHELGTPLNVITGNVQLLLKHATQGDPSRETLQLILRQVHRITEMVRRLLDFSRPTEARLVPVDLTELVHQTLELAPALVKEMELRLELDPDTPPVLGDATLLEHAFLNLLINAAQATPSGGRLTVACGEEAESTDGGAPHIAVLVGDTGCGIAPESLPLIFQPFFTTKAQGRGTGLGLAIVERIIRQHRGRIEVESRPGHGTVFTVRLRSAASSGTLGAEVRKVS